MGRLARVGSLAAFACAVAVATRVPGPTFVAAASAVLAAATLLLACVATAEGRRWAPPLALASGAGLLLLPPSTQAWLHVPAVVVAAPMLLLFHAVLRPHSARTPRLAEAPPAPRMRKVARLSPWVVLATLAAATPWLARLLLPDRLGLASELQGPSGPLLAAAIIAVGAVAVALGARAVAHPGGDLP